MRRPGPPRSAVAANVFQEEPPWDGLACYGLYEGALRDALLRLKFGGELSLAPLLGPACWKPPLPARPDALLAVPQHPAHSAPPGLQPGPHSWL